MIRRAAPALALALASIVAPNLAHAGGFEYSAAGTRALGRGGAFMARADDPLALRYNPAGLAFLPGYQLELGSHLAFYDSCILRSGGYDDSNVSDSATWDSRYGFPDTTDPDNWINQNFPRADPLPKDLLTDYREKIAATRSLLDGVPVAERLPPEKR